MLSLFLLYFAVIFWLICSIFLCSSLTVDNLIFSWIAKKFDYRRRFLSDIGGIRFHRSDRTR